MEHYAADLLKLAAAFERDAEAREHWLKLGVYGPTTD
jgi:hypothetical protein